MKKNFLAIILELSISLFVFAQKSDSDIVSNEPRIQKINQLLSDREKDGLNGVILIRSRNKVLLHKGYGFADKEKNKRMTVATGFDIGSLVKPMTGVAILKLEQQGKLSASDTLSRFFPDAPEDKKNITILQLLTHTAGMQDVFGGDYEVVSRDWLLERALNAQTCQPAGREKTLFKFGLQHFGNHYRKG